MSVGIGAAGGDFGEDGIAVRERLVERLEHEDAGPFRAHVAVRVFAEHATTASRRQHAGLGEGDEAEGMQVQADAAGQGGVAFTGANGLTGLMKGYQGRRAGRVDGHAGSLEIEHVRQPIGGDAEGVAGGEQIAQRGQVGGMPIGEVRTGDADIDPAAAAAQARGGDARVLERFPGQLQQQALLGIHGRRFPGRNSEEVGVEAADVAE